MINLLCETRYTPTYYSRFGFSDPCPGNSGSIILLYSIVPPQALLCFQCLVIVDIDVLLLSLLYYQDNMLLLIHMLSQATGKESIFYCLQPRFLDRISFCSIKVII